MSKEKWIVVVALILGLILIGFMCTEVKAQTPPVSLIAQMPDSTLTTEIPIHFVVSSDIAWDQAGGVGIYYRTPAMEDWSYAGGTYTSPLVWTPPYIDTGYIFCSTVSDNEGNNEGYEFSWEAVTYYLPGENPPDAPLLRWHWSHPTEGAAVAEYEAEWKVNENIRVLQGIAVGDTTFAYVDVAYTPGQNQTLRVRGLAASGNAGDWSPWGDIWADVFPGTTGTPAGTLVRSDGSPIDP